MEQLGGFINPFTVIDKAKKLENIFCLQQKELTKNKLKAIKSINTKDTIVDIGLDFLAGKFNCLEITLTNIEMKDIIKVIRSLENRGILWKKNYQKLTSEERRIFQFFRPLMIANSTNS